MTEPAAVETVNERGRSRFVLTCEHASNFIPSRYGGLGLSSTDLQRHIAWDIGAANVARELARLIDAPLFLSGYSRLLIDCNRPIGSPTSIPEISETTIIPGNVGISASEATYRAENFYWPFQNAISAHLDRRQAAGKPTVIIGIHSFTPIFKGIERPWHAGILFRKSRRFAEALLKALDEPGLVTAPNEPYTIDDDGDYTVPIHGEKRGHDAVLVEIRQDLISHSTGAGEWARRLAKALDTMNWS